MKKSEMFEIISKKSGIDKKDVDKVFYEFNNLLADALRKGEIVQINGFGKFYVKDMPSVRRVNPITRRFYMTKAQKVTKFRAYKKLKHCVN